MLTSPTVKDAIVIFENNKIDLVISDITLEDAIYLIKKGSRNYAKRQLTWFRKDKRTIWINKDDFNSDNEILDFMIDSIKENSIIK